MSRMRTARRLVASIPPKAMPNKMAMSDAGAMM